MFTDRDRAILDLEAQVIPHDGVKEQRILRDFGLSATHYYQRLNALLDVADAMYYAPSTVIRLRRLRERRRNQRSA